MVKVLAQEMKTVGVKNFTVHTCTLLTLVVTVHVHAQNISRELAGQLYSNTYMYPHRFPLCQVYDHGMIMRAIDC